MTKALIVPVLGPTRVEDRDLNADIDSMHLIQTWVDGEFTVLIGQGWHAYIPADPSGQRFNERATALLRAEAVFGLVIAGNAVFLGSARDPLEHDCPRILIDWMKHTYGGRYGHRG